MKLKVYFNPSHKRIDSHLRLKYLFTSAWSTWNIVRKRRLKLASNHFCSLHSTSTMWSLETTSKRRSSSSTIMLFICKEITLQRQWNSMNKYWLFRNNITAQGMKEGHWHSIISHVLGASWIESLGQEIISNRHWK